MQAQPTAEIDYFAAARAYFERTLQWLESGQARCTHSEVERELRRQGEVLMRAMLQGHLDLRAAEEKRHYQAEPRDPEVRVRTRPRHLETGFGRVKVARLGHKVDGAPAVFPLDRELNLPPEIYSLEVRQIAAVEAQRGSWDEVVEALNRYTGAHVPKRQAQELADRAARDFDGFYETTAAPVDDELLKTAFEAASCDGKGVVMLTKGLRDATRKEAAQQKATAVRGDPMAPKKLRKKDKRMAIVTANWEQEPFARTADQVLAKLDRQPDSHDRPAQRPPRPQNKRVRASLEKSQAEGISEMFDELERRNPNGERLNVVLVDGEERQMENVRAEARARSLSIIIVLDLIHVIHYLWIAGYALCDKDPAATEQWVRVYLKRLLTGRANYVAAAIRRQATLAQMTEEARTPVDKCCDYLLKNQDCLRYSEYLAQGLPIATGVIEGTCRHLVQDRMGITGARWDVPGGEAVLKLRAIRCSGDWDDYWTFHEQEEMARNHQRLAA
jgi:hypothetical protein